MACVCVLQHLAVEGEGVCERALRRLGHEVVELRLDAGEAVPAADAFDAWVVLGGLMSAYELDAHSFLRPERALLAKLIEADRPVLGICLGAQLLAGSAGGRVYPQRPKEIGLNEVALTDAGATDPLVGCMERTERVCQWHGDTFDLPIGAVHLARSQRFENQAFRLGRRVYAMQFHLEFTPPIVAWLKAQCPDDAAGLAADDPVTIFDGELHATLNRGNDLLSQMIGRWAEMF